MAPDPSRARPPPGGTFTSGGLLLQTVRVWGRNALAFTLVSALVEAPLAALQVRAGETPGPQTQAGLLFFTWIAGMLASGALAQGVLQQLAGERPRVRAMLGTVVSRLWPVFAVSALYAATILAGLFLFVVPAFLAGLAGFVAVPAVIAEPELGAVEGLRRSWALTRGHRLPILWASLCLLGLELFMVVNADMVLGGLAAPFHTSVVAVSVLEAVLTGFTGCCSAVAYEQLRALAQPGRGSPPRLL